VVGVFEIGVFYHSYENPKMVQTNFSGSLTNTNRNSLSKVQIAPLSSGGPLQAFTFSEPLRRSVVLNGDRCREAARRWTDDHHHRINNSSGGGGGGSDRKSEMPAKHLTIPMYTFCCACVSKTYLPLPSR
jgi:hypothetical protein